jgi:quinol-cytochrome oxidoreductase complex cytochrome b subunit
VLGTRSRVAEFLRRVADLHVPDSYGGLRWLSAAIIVLFLILLATGTLLSLYYYPEPDAAYDSIRFITGRVPAGWLMRSVHHWAGELMLVGIVAHLCVTFFRRAYARPREYNWFVGVLLLVIVLEFRFTGRLLPWDTLGHNATRRGLDLLARVPLLGELWATWLRGGGMEMAAKSLSRFFTTHVLILPWLTVLLGTAHLYLVRRHGLKEDER